MNRFIGLIAAALTLPTMVQANGFCVDDLSKAQLRADLVNPNALLMQHEPGYIQILCLDCTMFQQVEIFLGVDGADRESTLRDPDTLAAAVAEICDRGIPMCDAEGIEIKSTIGLRSSYVTGPFAQSSVLLFTGGERLTIRATADASLIEWANTATHDTLTTLTASVIPPCT